MNTNHPIPLAGAVFHADLNGALVWPDERTLVVADLHLEKGSSFARRGVMLPPYDTRATLDRLQRAGGVGGACRVSPRPWSEAGSQATTTRHRRPRSAAEWSAAICAWVRWSFAT